MIHYYSSIVGPTRTCLLGATSTHGSVGGSAPGAASRPTRVESCDIPTTTTTLNTSNQPTPAQEAT